MNIIESLPLSTDLIYNNKPIYIILIDSRTPNITLDSLNIMHKMMGLKMFAYHYFINKQGNIFRGRPENAYAADIEKLLNVNNNDNPFDSDKEVSNARNISSSNKIFICIEGNTELSEVTNSQYTNLVNLCSDIINRNRNIKNIYSFSELIPEITNLGSYFKMNEFRSEVYKTNLPLYTASLSGYKTYSFGKRILYYDDENTLSGNDVKLLQLYLDAIGIPIYKKNGIYDLFTYNAVKDFQTVFKLEVTGRMESDDYSKLEEVLKSLNNKVDPSSYHRLLYYRINSFFGEDVKLIQQKLKLLNYNIKVTGIYDNQTENAVSKFQSDYNLLSDGQVGPITYNTLMSSLAIEFTRTLKYTNDDELMYGDDVLFIQKKIKKCMKKFGISTITVTGYYDKITANNIKKIQISQFLPPTGAVDRVMFEFLRKI